MHPLQPLAFDLIKPLVVGHPGHKISMSALNIDANSAISVAVSSAKFYEKAASVRMFIDEPDGKRRFSHATCLSGDELTAGSSVVSMCLSRRQIADVATSLVARNDTSRRCTILLRRHHLLELGEAFLKPRQFVRGRH